jgi:tRNA/rRNA methyltransferase
MFETNQPIIILDRPQMPENIGAVARVMANFGLKTLRLVKPRDEWPTDPSPTPAFGAPPEENLPKSAFDRVWASSSGAYDVVRSVRVFASVSDAIYDCHRVHATTARNRELNLDVHSPRQIMPQIKNEVDQGQKIAFLFGAERAGLETRDIALCASIIFIPVDEDFYSLNLSQAVGIVAYEWRLMSQDNVRLAFQERPIPSSAEDLRGLFNHLEDELDKGGFFYPPSKREGMVRNIRALLSRAGLSAQEVSTFRGIVTALAKGRGRIMQKRLEAMTDAAEPTKDDK